MTTRKARAKAKAKNQATTTPTPTAIYCPVRPMRKNIAKTDRSGHPLDLGEGRRVRSTTVICVRRGDSMVMAADGQVTLGSTVMKHSAKKIRRLYNEKILAGF